MIERLHGKEGGCLMNRRVEKNGTLGGVFSSETLPVGWVDQVNSSQVQMVEFIEQSELGLAVIGEIPRSSNSRTFLVRGGDGLRVWQFGPPVESGHGLKKERLNPMKFEIASETVALGRAGGVNLPRIGRFGFMSMGEEERGYVEMEYMPGVGADRFLRGAGEFGTLVYGRVGEQLGLLGSIEAEGALDIRDKLRVAFDFMEKEGTYDKASARETLRDILKRIEPFLGVPTRLVHTDPFPVNWQVSGARSNPRVGLLDVEAIQVGNPWLEGIGRAMQWGAVDWFYIVGAEPPSGVMASLVAGFNSKVDEPLKISGDSVFWGDLMEASELVWLPQAICIEMLKDVPSETPERRKSVIKKLLKQNESE